MSTDQRWQAPNNYLAAVVTEDFLQGGNWTASQSEAPRSNYTWGSSKYNPNNAVAELKSSASTLVRLDKKQCIEAYGGVPYESQWRNVLVVTSHQSNENLIGLFANCAGNSGDWMCMNNTATTRYYEDYDDDYKCSYADLRANHSDWTFLNLRERTTNSTVTFNASVEYCLAGRDPGHCTVEVSTLLLLVVIGCNLVKTMCLIVTVYVLDFEPLATVGDAIASFLDRPDATTAGYGAICGADAEWMTMEHEVETWEPRPFKRTTKRWIAAPSPGRWAQCILLCAAVWCTALIFRTLVGFGSTNAWTFESSGADNMLGFTVGMPLLATILVTNMPQLAVSLLYVSYNNVLTCMLLAHEYTAFASFRKPLRVTRPSGKQRSTYWLQLPYRYIIPLMTAMALLHWRISRSIFIVQLSVYGINTPTTAEEVVAGCGGSPLALALVVVLGGLMISALVGLSLLKQLDPGMPVAGSNSVAISAACHLNPGDEGAARLSLMYGVEMGGDEDEHGRAHAGFSSRAVRPLREGEVCI
ncbi:hypothetical protein LTR56_026037 [Elasticomyces elasticus]|nr:hypothetical protein LTR56_026037 [Elasticomyces elasticus]KAK3620067.1 hypothetical protein LTR22_025745 [Elasticomyces elasticus]KAK4905000.1 hypothetical protein LTR49_025647 [Elasticomyces elasticus]KAK5738868.1 hypothetical protein LTS12_025460 [Elasticomyces elasticus]